MKTLSRHKTNMLDPEWVAKERERWRIKAKKAYANGKRASTASIKKWTQLNRNKSNAQKAANRAVKRNLFTRPDCCQKCGTPTARLQKHHPDYSKPLVVEWLCCPCHALTWRKPISGRYSGRIAAVSACPAMARAGSTTPLTHNQSTREAGSTPAPSTTLTT